MSAMKEAWNALRAVINIADKVQDLSAEVRDLRKENQEMRERLVRLETIIEEARTIRRSGAATLQTSTPLIA